MASFGFWTCNVGLGCWRTWSAAAQVLHVVLCGCAEAVRVFIMPGIGL